MVLVAHHVKTLRPGFCLFKNDIGLNGWNFEDHISVGLKDASGFWCEKDWITLYTKTKGVI